MGPDGAVNIIHRRQLEAIDDEQERAAKRLELAEEIRANIDPYVAAGYAKVDDVIDPADTRMAIARGLEVSAAKRVDRPWRKHGVLPV
jgi:acetyl-CoA carboxylase carboxyltransferase component